MLTRLSADYDLWKAGDIDPSQLENLQVSRARRAARLPSRADAMRVTLRWPDAVPRARAQAMPRDHAKGLLWWQWVEMKRGVETHDRDAVEPAWAER